MKEITISFSADELIELAKQLYMGSYCTIGFPYDNQQMADDILNRVCAVGLLEIPERGAFKRGGDDDSPFQISNDLYEECEPIIEQFEASAIQDKLPYELADRDFKEKYGKMEALNNPKVLAELKAIQEKYKIEFELYGVRNLRLGQEK